MAYARRGSGHEPEQLVCYAVVTETDIAHATTGGYRLSIPTETRAYELTGYGTTSSPVAYATLVSNYATALSNAVVEYHDTPPSGFRRRIIERMKVKYYNSASMPNPLGFGTVDPLALVYETYQLDLTDGLLSAVMGTRVTGAMITEGGYVELDTDTYWLPSGRATIAATTFYIPTAFTDPFSNVTSLTYDAYNMLVTGVEDALLNTVAAANDYRFLTPKEITDPNGNRVQVAFDHVGRVTKVAVMGQVHRVRRRHAHGPHRGIHLRHDTVDYQPEAQLRQAQGARDPRH